MRHLRRLAVTALVAGVVAGTLDGAAACIDTWLRFHRGPERVFLFIATGVFGPEVLRQPGMWPWGVLFHYLIATGWATLFALVFPSLPPAARRRPAVLGALYGLVVWLLMNKVVVPLSRVPPFSPPALQVVKGIAILMVCVGLPIALIVARRANA